MRSKLPFQILNHLRRYLRREISLSDFREWFDVETWGLPGESDSPARQLAGEIELRIAEFTNGHRTEEDLRAMLQPLLQLEPVIKR